MKIHLSRYYYETMKKVVEKSFGKQVLYDKRKRRIIKYNKIWK